MTSVGAWALGGAARTLAATWRIEFVGRERMQALRSGSNPRVSVLWHEHLLPLLWTNRGCGAVIIASRHPDGRRLAAASRRWGYESADGSSTRGGTAALRRAIRVLRAGGEVAIAADGPRGPYRTAKPGAVFAARHAGAVIVPVAAGASRAWRLGSWDRLMVPAPYAHVRVVYGEPIQPHAVTSDADGIRMLEEGLQQATRLAAC